MFGEYFIFWIFGGFVVIAIIVGLFTKAQHEKRRREMAEFAATDGFDYYPDGIAQQPSGFFESLLNQPKCPIIDQLDHLQPFGFGFDKTVQNLLVRQDQDISIYAMDYTCKTREGSGKNQSVRTHRFTVVCMRQGLVWPHIQLSPEGFGHKVSKLFGMRDLSLESEEFNKKYFVSAEDERSAYDILHPQCIDFLLRIPARDWQMSNMFVVVHDSGNMTPQEIRRIIQDMKDFVSLVPDYVKQDRGFQPKWQGALDF